MSSAAYADLVLHWRDSDRLLLSCETGQLSYRTCATLGDCLARAMLAAGIERPARVAAVLPNGPEFVTLLYACARIGVTLVPLSTWSRPAELRRVLASAMPEFVVTRDAFAGHGMVAALQVARDADPALARMPIYQWSPGESVDNMAGFLSQAGHCDQSLWDRTIDQDHSDADLVILYTSGSTGQPKGVMLRQSSVARNGTAIAQRMGFGPADTVFSYFPLFFSGGLCNALTGAMSCGAQLVTQAKFDPMGALGLIRARKCTGRNVWHDGLEPIAALPDFRPEDLATMRRGLHIDASFRERLGLEVDEGVNMYGMTETCTAFTCGVYTESRQIRETTHGRPFPGSDIRIAGLGTGSPARTGEAGEICVRGYNLMRGYTDGSASDRIEEDGFFHTGDIGYLDASGYLHFVGRQKTLIKLKGLTVQPEEVEATLLRHSEVVKAVVLGRGGGHESEGLVALVVLEHNDPESISAIETYVRKELSSYKVPQIIVVDDAKFPLSASLKIDRVAATALLRELDPG